MIGIFAIDPGGHTGVVWGIVDERAPSAAEAARNRLQGGSATIIGEPMEQARAIWELWERFKRVCVVKGCMDPDKVELVSEDFVLRGGQHAGGKDGTAPERIIWAFEGYRWGRYDTYRKIKHIAPIIWQLPGARQQKRAILENAGLWFRGREHERSAGGHFLLRVMTVMSQNRR